MPSVHEVNQLNELAGYRLLWNALLSQASKATFFQSLDWLEVYWQHYGCDQRLRVLIVSAAGRPVGVFVGIGHRAAATRICRRTAFVKGQKRGCALLFSLDD